MLFASCYHLIALALAHTHTPTHTLTHTRTHTYVYTHTNALARTLTSKQTMERTWMGQNRSVSLKLFEGNKIQ